MKLDDLRPRPQDWKRLMARLDAAYQKDGHAALAAMSPIESLALRNEKVRDFKAISGWLESNPEDATARDEQATLAKEINDMTRWIKSRQREMER